MRRCAVCLLSLLLVFTCGCIADDGQSGQATSKPAETVKTVALESMTLSYNYTYTLDPYSANTALNLQICKLCFEPLFALDNEADVYGLLGTAIQKLSDTQYLITVNPNRVFWDGSSVTSDDVVFSYSKAVSGANYAYLATAVFSVTKQEDKVLVTLTKPNVNFDRIFTFPIIKNLKYSSYRDFVGTGLYEPSYGSNIELRLNTLHPRAASANVKTVSLIDSPDFEAMNDSVSAGLLNGFYSDMSGDSLPGISGNVFGVCQNRALYLGFNRIGSCADVNLRLAISMSIDRRRLVSYFGGYCEVAKSLFHPVCNEDDCSSLAYDSTAVDALFEELGELGELTFLVCKTNTLKANMAEEIVNELKSAGFTVKLDSVSYEDYVSRISSGGYDFYLGDMQLSDDNSFASLISGAVTNGIMSSATLVAARDEYLATGDPAALLREYNAEMPFSMLLYRRGIVAYSSNLVITESDSFNFAFCNIELSQVVKKVVVGQ